MAMTRWDPIRELLNLQERMNQLLEQSRAWPRGEEAVTAAWTPAVDIYETGEAIVLRADLPGVKRNDIDVQVRDNMLILKGERKFEKEENYLRVERSYGAFHRSFTLPAVVQQDRIRAVLKDGVLELKFCKSG